MDNFESIAVALSSDGNFDEVYVVVNRVNGRMIERMALRLYAEEVNDEIELYVKNQIFLDSSVSYNNTLSQSTFTGLDHLEDQEVGILADGEVLANETITGGVLTLPSSYIVTVIGLPYQSDIVTLPAELGQQ